MMSTMTVTVDALSAQGKGNLAVRLVSTNAQPMPAFEAGAHIDVHLPNGLIRQYSISNGPNQRHSYLLCVRKEPASRGGSASIHTQLRVGDTLTISMPRNVFALAPAHHYVLMAGGIGITPLLSMAESLDASGVSFELHYYVRDRDEAAFVRRINRGFDHGAAYVYSSQEGDSPRMFLPQSLGPTFKPDNDTANDAMWTSDMPQRRLYLCGSEGFMQHITTAAVARGWVPETIHKEAFAPVKPVVVSGGDAPLEASFEVALTSSQQVYVVPPGKSIASVLMAAGVHVPLSCEMGICGACLTPVIDGVVDHRDSVQSDAEKTGSGQHIALCCSRSCSPRLTIDL